MSATLTAPSSSSRPVYKQTLADLVTFYNETGYVIVRDAFTPDEVKVWSDECDRVLADKSIVHPDNHRTPFRFGATVEEGVPERIDPAIDLSPVFARLAQDERILSVVAAIFGGPAHVFKDKLIFKAPRVKGYDMHQDGSWWQMLPMPLSDMLSVMIAIDGADPANGSLELFPGYHRELLSTKGEIRNMTADEAKRIDLGKGVVTETRPGDVIIFHALAPHRSGVNVSDRFRRQFYLTYAAARHGDLYHSFYAKDREMKMANDRKSNPRLFYK